MRWLPDRPATGVFVILLASYAFFWHSRDWNASSRLMLTYLWSIDGQCQSRAWTGRPATRRSFTVSITPINCPGIQSWRPCPTSSPRVRSGCAHPLDQPNQAPFRYWAADYWITLGTSGILTAWTAALLVIAARELGCRRWPAALIGLAYGLSTPAYVYATLAYGHQASAFALFASFLLLWRRADRTTRADLRRWRARGLRKRDRASSRPCVGDPWLLSARAMSQSRHDDLMLWRFSS